MRNSMPSRTHLHLTRRERQAVDVIYRLGEATVAQVLGCLDDPPGYSAVRWTLSALKAKGVLKHREDGQRYVYYPALPRSKASGVALRRLVDTFFGGSPERAMVALLEASAARVSEDDRRHLEKIVAQAKKEGR